MIMINIQNVTIHVHVSPTDAKSVLGEVLREEGVVATECPAQSGVSVDTKIENSALKRLESLQAVRNYFEKAIDDHYEPELPGEDKLFERDLARVKKGITEEQKRKESDEMFGNVLADLLEDTAKNHAEAVREACRFNDEIQNNPLCENYFYEKNPMTESFRSSADKPVVVGMRKMDSYTLQDLAVSKKILAKGMPEGMSKRVPVELKTPEAELARKMEQAEVSRTSFADAKPERPISTDIPQPISVPDYSSYDSDSSSSSSSDCGSSSSDSGSSSCGGSD